MHFIPLIRNVALRHAATSCISEICLLCELGYLFDMLQKAEGSICQATNMLKTLSNHPQGSSHSSKSRSNKLLTVAAGPLGLLEEDPRGSSLNMMLQGLTRFLLEKIVHDFKTIEPSSTAMEQVSCLENTQPISYTNKIDTCHVCNELHQLHVLPKRIYSTWFNICQRLALSSTGE